MKTLVLDISRAISNLEWISQSHATSLRLGDIKRDQQQQQDVMSFFFSLSPSACRERNLSP